MNEVCGLQHQFRFCMDEARDVWGEVIVDDDQALALRFLGGILKCPKGVLPKIGASFRGGKLRWDESHQASVLVVPPLATIRKVLEDSDLSSRELKILTLYFGLEDGRERTDAAVGEVLGISKTRAGDIRQRALRKMKQPCRMDELIPLYMSGLDEYLVSYVAKQKKENEWLEAACSACDTKIQALTEENARLTRLVNSVVRGQKPNERDAKSLLDTVMETAIEELGLSARSYNQLHRYGWTTVAAIVEHTESELRNLRYLGPKSCAEIICKIESLGLEFKKVD